MPAGLAAPLRRAATRYDDTVYALAHEPYIMLLASTAISLGGQFALLLPVLTATTAWRVWRDRPYRTHWLVPVAVGAAFSLAFFDLRTAAQFRDWQWQLMVTGSLSLMMAGALDHRLLMTAMPAADAAKSVEHADTI
jgi:hypothetical protein